MTCIEIRRLIYSTTSDELRPSEQEIVDRHLAQCPACTAEFQKCLEADRILAHVKHAAPHIRNSQALTESILATISSRTNSYAEIQSSSCIDRLIEFVSKKSIRLACACVVLLLGITFLAMEYNDATALVSLEQRLGMKTDVHRALLFQQEITALHFLNDLYHFSTGSNSSVELTNTLILMKKTDIRTLLKGYETLDEASQNRLKELWDTYKEKEPPGVSDQHDRDELLALRKEVARLKKELDHYTHKKDLP